MCIIFYKKANQAMPSKNLLKKAFTQNPDGAGIMFHSPESKQVQIRKGFMTFDLFWKAYTDLRLKPRDTIVYHFRKKTSGKIEAGYCHPFPVSNRIKDLFRTQFNCEIGMAHNGVIDSGTKALSDTQLFILEILSSNIILKNIENEAIRGLIEGYINKSRIIVLTPDKTILFGTWISQHGLLCSKKMSRYESWDATDDYLTRFKKNGRRIFS